MKLQFKHQQFQADAAAAAVVDIFKGMPRSTHEYLFDLELSAHAPLVRVGLADI